MNLCRNRYKTKIAFHSRHLPKSARTPSDTCNTRSAVCAILRLWVIIIMVCSYFFDASFNRAITSLLFCVSRFPVGSSARIKDGRVIRARPIATRCCCPAENGQLALVHGKNIHAANRYPAGCRCVKRAYHVEQRTFSRAGFPDDSYILALWNGKADFFQSVYGSFAASVGFTDMVDF